MPGPVVGWQDPDSTRDTLTIIQTCLATIFACTWTVQHLNVPAADDGRLRKFLRACKWMFITVLLPEFILAHAICELILALSCMRRMEQAASFFHPDYEIDVKCPAWMVTPRKWPWPSWLLSHPTPSPDPVSLEEQQQRPPTDKPADKKVVCQWTLSHAYFANMGGLVFTPPPDWPASVAGNPEQHRDAAPSSAAARPLTGIQLIDQLAWLPFPSVTEAEIRDKSKTDGFAKALSLLQISQLVLSLIVRRARGLPSSQLEVLTLAFAVCGVVTYIAYWYKPKDVSVPISVTPAESILQAAPTLDGGVYVRYLYTNKTFDSFWRVITNDANFHPFSVHRIPNDNIPMAESIRPATLLILVASVSTVFGSLHAIAWNFNFPTAAEAIIWHVCTVLTISLPPLGLLGIPLSQATFRQADPTEFLTASERILREVCWHLDNDEERSEEERSEANTARGLLGFYSDLVCLEPRGRPVTMLYRGIFWPTTGGFKHGLRLRQMMLDVVDKKAPFENRPELDLPSGYGRHLRELFLLLDGHGSKKMVEQVARTHVFPRRSMPAAVNMWLVFITMGLYCLARFTLIAISLSSLRAMPEGVYNSTWADLIPAI